MTNTKMLEPENKTQIFIKILETATSHDAIVRSWIKFFLMMELAVVAGIWGVASFNEPDGVSHRFIIWGITVFGIVATVCFLLIIHRVRQWEEFYHKQAENMFKTFNWGKGNDEILIRPPSGGRSEIRKEWLILGSILGVLFIVSPWFLPEKYGLFSEVGLILVIIGFVLFGVFGVLEWVIGKLVHVCQAKYDYPLPVRWGHTMNVLSVFGAVLIVGLLWSAINLTANETGILMGSEVREHIEIKRFRDEKTIISVTSYSDAFVRRVLESLSDMELGTHTTKGPK